jgi:hypothetical protein
MAAKGAIYSQTTHSRGAENAEAAENKYREYNKFFLGVLGALCVSAVRSLTASVSVP